MQQFSETQAVVQVCERLEARFPEFPSDAVEGTVTTAHRSFDGCRVRRYVPVLVEREARAVLDARRLVSR